MVNPQRKLLTKNLWKQLLTLKKSEEKWPLLSNQFLKKQNVVSSPDYINQFFTLDNNEEPLNKLKRRAIPDHIKNTKEESLHDAVLTKASNEDMKPNSAPGIDGFTDKFIRAT